MNRLDKTYIINRSAHVWVSQYLEGNVVARIHSEQTLPVFDAGGTISQITAPAEIRINMFGQGIPWDGYCDETI